MGNLVKTISTTLTKEHLVYMLSEGWKELYGSYPSNDSLALLWAQVVLETGLKSCYNWNLGNVKRNGNHDYCMYRCSEIINGKEQWFDPPHPQTHFNAYESDIAGAKEYIQFISQRKRYRQAWQAVLKGDPTAFSHALKVAGYYTADEGLYTRGIVKLTNQFKKYMAAKPLQPATTKPPVEPVKTTVERPVVEPEPQLPDISEIQLIFDWNHKSHSLAVEDTPPLTLTFLEKIFSFILELIKSFSKK
jgi:hypothetical protein